MVIHTRTDDRRASLLPRRYHFADTTPAPAPRPAPAPSAPVAVENGLTVGKLATFSRDALAEGFDPETPVHVTRDDDGNPTGLIVFPPAAPPAATDLINQSWNPGSGPDTDPGPGETPAPGQIVSVPAQGGPLVGQVTITSGPDGAKVDEPTLEQAMMEMRRRQSVITPRRPGSGPTRW